MKNYGWMGKDIIFTKIDNLRDESSKEVKRKIDEVADLNTNILLVGETGVGKDFWAEYLYKTSKYPNLINLNCGDVPETLIESEWFGYKKGAFTGADTDYEGKWASAENGILFLNQIDLLSYNIQSKLLRIIERKKYFPLGSSKERSINTRFIFSADSEIFNKVKNGEFRADLFYRIAPFIVEILPLRKRNEDVLPLIEYFAKAKEMSLSISKNGLKLLKKYPWKGNIRELENFVNRCSIMSGRIIDEDIFGLIDNIDDFIETEFNREKTLYELEKEYINFLLRKYKNKTRIAKILDISRKSLYNKINSFKKDDAKD